MADGLQPSSITAVPPLTRAAWRESALTRATELRGRTQELLILAEPGRGLDEVGAEVLAHVAAAEQAVTGRDPATGERVNRGAHWLATLQGASVERAQSQLDAAEAGLLRLAPESYVLGQMPAIVARARAHLPADDPRLQRLARLAEHYAPARNGSGPTPAAAGASPLVDAEPATISQVDRESTVTALRATTQEERREVARVRSFRNILLCTALALTVCAGALLVVGIVEPRAIRLCFIPNGAVVCPTHSAAVAQVPGGGTGLPSTVQAQRLDGVMRDTASSWDIAVVELVGLLAAALAAAAALRKMEGTSTPYSLPTALAVVKLPTGALTAVLGLLLIRGAFIPGLSALDTSGQILAWAVIFGYAQQVFTRFVDERAQGVLDAVGTVDKAKAKGITVPSDARLRPSEGLATDV